jgi:hypothetical protein
MAKNELRLMVIKAWVHDNGNRLERWWNHIINDWQDTPPDCGMRHSIAESIKKDLLVPQTTVLKLVPFINP